MDTALQRFLTGLAAGLVDAQLELDEAGRDSIDAFDETGVPPTVLAWSGLRMQLPLAVTLVPKSTAAQPSEARLTPHGGARLGLNVRYFLSPQGVDDPRPAIPRGPDTT